MGLLNHKMVKEDAENRNSFGSGVGRGPFAAPSLPKLEIYEKGTNRINIIPYRIATKNHPRVIAGKNKVGDIDYRLVFFVHNNLGPSKQSAICAKETFGKPCAVCDYKNKLKEEAEAERDLAKQEIAKAIYPSKRCAMVVQDFRAEDPKALRFAALSYANFMKPLEQKQADCEEGGAVINYPDTGTDGMVVNFRSSKTSKAGMKFDEFRDFSFAPRDEEEAVDESLVEEAPSLDKGLTIPNYKDVEAMIYGEQPEEAEVEEPTPAAKTSTKAAPKAEEVKVISENPDDDKPASKTSAKASGDPACPEGGKFGADTDSYKKCAKCPHYTACNAKYETTH